MRELSAVTVVMSKKPDSVSLYSEISELADALEGSRTVLYGLHEVHDGFRSHEGRQLLASGLSMIGLLVARMRLVARVLHGDTNPLTVLTPENRLPRFAEEASAGDALLRPWSEAKQAEVAGAEAERLRRWLKRSR